VVQQAIHQAEQKGLVGQNILEYGCHAVCTCTMSGSISAAKSALIESLEEESGWPRLNRRIIPPRWTLGPPTNVNNVETLAFVPRVLEMGAERFAALGTPKKRRTVCFAFRNVKRPGCTNCRWAR